ncbi:MAG: SRPBCC family protein [Bacteroidia bacterium]
MKTNIMAHTSISIAVSPKKIWDAITDPKIISQWFLGTKVKSDWQVGSPVKFHGEYQGKKYEDKGTVLKNIPEKLLEYEFWSSMSGIEDKPENYVIVSYEITQGKIESTLTVTEHNLPDEKMKKRSEEIWKKVFHTMKEVLEKENTPA